MYHTWICKRWQCHAHNCMRACGVPFFVNFRVARDQHHSKLPSSIGQLLQVVIGCSSTLMLSSYQEILSPSQKSISKIQIFGACVDLWSIDSNAKIDCMGRMQVAYASSEVALPLSLLVRSKSSIWLRAALPKIALQRSALHSFVRSFTFRPAKQIRI